MKPNINRILELTEELTPLKLILGDLSPKPNTTKRQRKLVITLIAIVVHQTWKMRCEIFHERAMISPEQAWIRVRNQIAHLTTQHYHTAKMRNDLTAFKQKFLIKNSLGSLINDKLVLAV